MEGNSLSVGLVTGVISRSDTIDAMVLDSMVVLMGEILGTVSGTNENNQDDVPRTYRLFYVLKSHPGPSTPAQLTCSETRSASRAVTPVLERNSRVKFTCT